MALTANAVSGAREKYIAAGFTDYLTKPIDSSRSENMLMKYLPPEKIRPAEGGQEKRSAFAEKTRFLMSKRGRFISGADYLMDGGTTASYWYGDLQYLKKTH